MNSLEFIEFYIKEYKRSVEWYKKYQEKNPTSFVNTLKEEELILHHLQQIKAELTAWEVIKKHCDYQDYDRFNCIPEGFYLIEPIKGKDYLTIKKALEAEE